MLVSDDGSGFDAEAVSRGDGFGQTDVGGIYAYLMLQCFELTGEDRYVREARAADSRY